MANTTRKAILRKYDRISPGIETLQQHILDNISIYIELDGNRFTIEQLVNDENALAQCRYGKQIAASFAMLETLDTANNLITDLIKHVKRM